ncbi:yeats family-domain-containing protein [Naematelia encephala]|uniref:Protein AF-9 homolog n=1 Tax=Naematelia encephala TaxID=71784 RepID=A0A1Y2BFL4_9TREE|nr:yeats family-domain-containing protein [Naematelia encephala]
MSNERQRNIQVHRPVIYGSHARLLTDAEKELAPPGHTHRWTVFFTSATSPPPSAAASSSSDPILEDIDYLPGGADDLSYLVKKVTFRLHETYSNPSRVCDKPPFKVTETGWGEFTVQIRLQFVQESGEKPMNFAHTIKLHHWGPPIEAPLESSTAPPTEDKMGEGTPVKAEVETPAPPTAIETTPKPEEQTQTQSQSQTPGAATGESNPTPGEPTSTSTPAPASASEPMLSQPISVASKYPVHAWQYDELVFSDPPLSFLNILNANPATPLPPRNRRPRNQREEHEIRTGKKSKKTAAPQPSESRQATPAQTIGVPGELGSADVPLEFSAEMEKAEWNRINDARLHIVSEMDRWREKLIAMEKECAKLKEEMKAP